MKKRRKARLLMASFSVLFMLVTGTSYATGTISGKWVDNQDLKTGDSGLLKRSFASKELNSNTVGEEEPSKESDLPVSIKKSSTPYGADQTKNSNTGQQKAPITTAPGVAQKISAQVEDTPLVVDEAALAQTLLNAEIAKNPILVGATIKIQECPNNWQACAWYKRGEIWIDPDHTAPLERIISHEVAHIIDWREDGDIDNNDYHE
ncbi:MAG: hypothetical protein QMD53_01350 [Actinomycetota bacterium]|nr:hypothetical protein [Actinomycetota bacterium]